MPSSMPYALPSTTFAVLRPTPGSATSSAIVRGTSPPWSRTSPVAKPMRLFALARKKPVLRMISSTSAGGAAASDGARRVAREEVGRHHVDALVRALRGEDRGDRELEGVAVVERALRIGMASFEDVQDLPRALGEGRGLAGFFEGQVILAVTAFPSSAGRIGPPFQQARIDRAWRGCGARSGKSGAWDAAACRRDSRTARPRTPSPDASSGSASERTQAAIDPRRRIAGASDSLARAT